MIDLKKEFPSLFDKHLFEISLPEGWENIVRLLCKSIIWRNEKLPDNIMKLKIIQIKEKFGTLRFYSRGGDDYIDGLIQMAENMSGVTCQVCGKPGHLVDEVWLKTVCDEHI